MIDRFQAHMSSECRWWLHQHCQGKGRKDRQVPISDDVYGLVLAYLDATGRAVWNTADRGTPLFLSRNVSASKARLSVRRA